MARAIFAARSDFIVRMAERLGLDEHPEVDDLLKRIGQIGEHHIAQIMGRRSGGRP